MLKKNDQSNKNKINGSKVNNDEVAQRMQRTEERETVRMLHPCQLANWVDYSQATQHMNIYYEKIWSRMT